VSEGQMSDLESKNILMTLSTCIRF
jgi:hypothetical protein